MKDSYLELARTIKELVGPDVGFALLMELERNNYRYASSAQRADVCQVLNEWIARVGIVNSRDLSETSDHARECVTLEERCADLGHRLESRGHRLILFLFDYGGAGSLAWYSNTPEARRAVQNFLATAAISQ